MFATQGGGSVTNRLTPTRVYTNPLISNLVTLCQHHHNIKTDRRVHYIMDPITGTIAWLHQDGTYHIDHPQGPLATHNTHWHYTWTQFLNHKRNKLNNKK